MDMQKKSQILKKIMPMGFDHLIDLLQVVLGISTLGA
jgi:hypothetical protein